MSGVTHRKCVMVCHIPMGSQIPGSTDCQIYTFQTDKLYFSLRLLHTTQEKWLASNSLDFIAGIYFMKSHKGSSGILMFNSLLQGKYAIGSSIYPGANRYLLRAYYVWCAEQGTGDTRLTSR